MKISRIDVIGQNGNDGEHYEAHASGEALAIKLDAFYPHKVPFNENRRMVLDTWRSIHHKQVNDIHDKLLRDMNIED